MLHGAQVGLGKDGGEAGVGDAHLVRGAPRDTEGIQCTALGGEEAVGSKAPIQQLLRLGVADIPILGSHDDADEGHALPLGRDRHAEARLGGGACFQTVTAAVEAHQAIGVGETELTVSDGVHPGGAEFQDLLMADQLTGHDGDISRRGDVVLGGIVQAVGVLKVGGGHAQLGGSLVHALDKSLLRAVGMLGQGHGGIVGRGDDHALDEVAGGHLLSLLEVDLGATHGGGVGGGGDRVLPLQGSCVDTLHDEEEGHDLGDRGGGHGLGGVMGVEDLPRGGLHEDGAFAVGGEGWGGRGIGFGGGGQTQGGREEEEGQEQGQGAEGVVWHGRYLSFLVKDMRGAWRVYLRGGVFPPGGAKRAVTGMARLNLKVHGGGMKLKACLNMQKR